jgi:hypothetical protein
MRKREKVFKEVHHVFYVMFYDNKSKT